MAGCAVFEIVVWLVEYGKVLDFETSRHNMSLLSLLSFAQERVDVETASCLRKSHAPPGNARFISGSRTSRCT